PTLQEVFTSHQRVVEAILSGDPFRSAVTTRNEILDSYRRFAPVPDAFKSPWDAVLADRTSPVIESSKE
ncbi:MAG: hypothetical protein ACPL7O_10155, partial [Armatimonadota bacterium]